jgi:hypothetical protein
MDLIIKSDQCPEFMIEMILAKLDYKNNQEEEIMKEIENLWVDSIIYYLTNSLNIIISTLNNKDFTKYYETQDVQK